MLQIIPDCAPFMSVVAEFGVFRQATVFSGQFLCMGTINEKQPTKAACLCTIVMLGRNRLISL